MLKIDRHAAEQLAERIASERVSLNATHFRLWGVVVAQLFERLQQGGLSGDEIRNLDKVAGILDRAQKGQPADTGPVLRPVAPGQAARRGGQFRRPHIARRRIDEVADEETRDRIAQAMMEASPMEPDEEQVG